MSFIQTISFRARSEADLNRLLDEWQSDASNAPGFQRAWLLKDRDTPGAYMMSVEFSSYEEAMRNSARPETDAYAGRLGSLVEGEVEYRNYDLVRSDGG